MERRTFLTGAGVAALLPVAGGATAKDQSLGDGGTAARQAPDLSAALQRFRATIPSHFDREYVNNAVVPFFLGSIFAGERPILPMGSTCRLRNRMPSPGIFGACFTKTGSRPLQTA